MTTFIIAIPLFLLAVGGLVLIPVLRRRPLRGSCGGCGNCLLRRG